MGSSWPASRATEGAASGAAPSRAQPACCSLLGPTHPSNCGTWQTGCRSLPAARATQGPTSQGRRSTPCSRRSIWGRVWRCACTASPASTWRQRRMLPGHSRGRRNAPLNSRVLQRLSLCSRPQGLPAATVAALHTLAVQQQRPRHRHLRRQPQMQQETAAGQCPSPLGGRCRPALLQAASSIPLDPTAARPSGCVLWPSQA